MASKLEEVHLDDCTSLMSVPSSMLSLDSLFALNLRGCKQLLHIQSKKQSRSLQWLNLRGCSKLVKYSVFSEKLVYLNLDGTTIEDLPSSVIGLDCTIQHLHCQRFEKLPGSIKHLSQLRDLNVSNCKRLRSLPELPFLLQDLNASNCRSLEIVSNLGIAMLQDSLGRLKKRSLLRQIQEEEKMPIRHGDYLGRFEFYNCINLAQIACKIVMDQALIRIQLAAYLSSKIEECYDPYCHTDEVSENFDPEDFVYISRPVYIVFPGNEVPDWFMHKRTDSLIMTIKLSKQWLYYCKYLGFAFCLVLGPSHSNRKKIYRIRFMAGCRYYFKGKYAGTCIIKSSCNDADSDHVWLWYDKLEETSKKVTFEFFVRPLSSGLVVKQCGIRPLYAPVDIMQSSNKQECSTSREGERPYVEFEANKIQRSYWLFRHYAHPPDSLRITSGRQRISGYPDGRLEKSFPLSYCARNVDILRIQHNCYRIGAEVFVFFGLVVGDHQPCDLQSLAQDDYCYFGELVDNIDAFSSLRRLSLNGCNVESLPASIKHLSRLEHLLLNDCKRLKSLPKLPPSLQYLFVSKCTSLKTVELAGNKGHRLVNAKVNTRFDGH